MRAVIGSLLLCALFVSDATACRHRRRQRAPLLPYATVNTVVRPGQWYDSNVPMGDFRPGTPTPPPPLPNWMITKFSSPPFRVDGGVSLGGLSVKRGPRGTAIIRSKVPGEIGFYLKTDDPEGLLRQLRKAKQDVPQQIQDDAASRDPAGTNPADG